MGNEAWITSAVVNETVDKAIVLAGSLRRVRTARKLVVITTLAVSEKLREKLRNAFDLVHLLDRKSPNGMDLENYAKFHSFSFTIFDKCVYLSPNAIVLRNCDEIFRRYKTFAAGYVDSKGRIDTAIYLYVPSLEFSRSLAEIGGRKDVNVLEDWLLNNFENIEKLDDQYNFKLDYEKNIHRGLNLDVSIVNFANAHPLDLQDEIQNRHCPEIGAFRKFCADLCWNIYVEDVKEFDLNSTWITSNKQYKVEPIAIVGMSFRLPGGNNIDEFWSLLAEGRNAIVPVPPHRWTKEHSFFHCKNRKIEAGFLNVPIHEFDSKFFGLSPKEAEFLDPQQRMLLEVTWEALEDAVIDPTKLSGSRAGVFVGSWIHDYKDMLMLSRSRDFDFFRTYMGNSIASSAARLSHFFEMTGPSIATESGCSSAIAAVDMACKSLRNGDSSLAVAAGVNLLLHRFDTGIMDYIISTDFRCKTFDESANGFARAEGCAVLLLKRLSDAMKDGDNIWGLIRGTALTQDGVSKSLGTPTVQCESMAMELALEDAGVDPKDVSYVEAHGTGTAVGDPMEILAINKAYSKGRIEPLLIGSVKTNVGHTESVSGITGIIKVLLSMKHELIPKHLNFNKLNPNINLEAIPAQIPLSPVPWPREEGRKRLAGVSSFGISGTDGHAIIEEPPSTMLPTKLEFGQERPLHIFKISTKSFESMDELVQKYLQKFSDRLERHGDDEKDFADFAYSANTGRATFDHRLIFTAKNFTDAKNILKEKSFKQSVSDKQSSSSGSKLCFLFTGQGSQYPNMARELYKTSPVFKANFDKCDAILQRRYNISIKDVLWTDAGIAGNNEKLNQTLYSQTSIFVVEYCLLMLWESWGVRPDYVLGHSLGEFAAAVAAGALHFEDALMLVAERSRLIDQLPRGKMLVIRAGKKTVDEMILKFQKIQPEFWVDYAALNSPEQTVVAGDPEMIEDFSKFCGEKSLKTIMLAATHAFHSRHMDSILEAYRKVAFKIKKPEVKPNQPKFISGMEGKLIEDVVASINSDYWVRHTREKVSYMDACNILQQEGCTLFLEVGPHPVLAALTMTNLDGKLGITCLPSLRRKEDEWSTMLDSLSKLYLSDWKGEIDWKGFDRFYNRKRVQLPFYPFNRKPVWSIMDSEMAEVHPLIGKLMPTASGRETIFQNSLTLKNTNFAKDHAIGNTVIFPGAGFLEMCLAGGHSTVQGITEVLMKPKRPIILKSLKITSPMAFGDDETCKVQTTVMLKLNCENEKEEEELGYSVEIHRMSGSEAGTWKWLQHASAVFLPMAPSLPSTIPKIMDISNMTSNWEKSDSKDFYEKLPEVGLKFGPQFQSLLSVWKREEGILASVKVPQDFRDYLIHPVIADAMIQAIILWTSKEKEAHKRKLQVPVQIGEFIWLKEVETSNMFVYCSHDENDKVAYCILLDGTTGAALAFMKGVDFIETTVKLVAGMISQQSSAMPQLWSDVWKQSHGPMQGYITHETSMEDLDYTEDELREFEQANELDEDELKLYKNLVQLSRLSFLKALYVLGWTPEKLKPFSVESVVNDLRIEERFHEYIRFFLRSLAGGEFEMLKSLDENENNFQFEVDPPSLGDLEKGLKIEANTNREEYKLIKLFSDNLSKILIGELDPLSILFPEDTKKPSAGKYYESCRAHTSVRPYASKMTTYFSRCMITTSTIKFKQCRPVYRILEVGAGTGVVTERLISNLMKHVNNDSLQIEYFVTDVSAAFFSSAEQTLREYLSNIVFKKFDMERDPMEQGFCPGYFDVITASDVFHIAKDIKKTMKSMRFLLKPGGMILFSDAIYPDERNTFIFGLLDGFWRFEDRDFRKNHNISTPEMWNETLRESGFHGISVIPLYNNVYGVISAYASATTTGENTFLKGLWPKMNSWIIFGENNNDFFTQKLSSYISNANRNCRIVSRSMSDCNTEESFKHILRSIIKETDHINIEGIVYMCSLSSNQTRDQKLISLPFLTLMKLISGLETPPRIYIVTKGVCSITTSDVINPDPATLIGLCKALNNENLNLRITYLDLDPNEENMNQLEEMYMNLWVEHKHSGVAFRDGLRLSPKLKATKIEHNEPLCLPNGCDRFRLVLPKSRLISDLEFGYLEPNTLEHDEVEIQVKAIALNFRDVLTILKPIKAFENFNTVGLDFAGVIVRVGKNVERVKLGERVFGMIRNDNLSLPSHYKTRESYVNAIPENMTFAEAATLPAVFSTVLYCLIRIGKLKQGDTILIHTASGGVGLAAIQLCNYIRANVIATAGSKRKRNYLRNLGVKHVFNSRTTDFKNEILKVTEGRGVDLVLNSITGPGFKEASMDVIIKNGNGRFIEMSKLNVWTREEAKVLRPDVVYENIDLTLLEPKEYLSLAGELTAWMKAGWVKPIPYERFDALNIRGALTYLQKAKHIGKVVCIMPDVKLRQSNLIAETPLFNEESTYLVTGGLGGIGLEVVKWMLRNGAKHIAIVTRSAPIPEIASQIETWNRTGNHVQAFSVDVGNYDKLKALFESLKNPDLGFPQLRGVMHAAGVLQDAVLENQSWATFTHTYNPKVNGSWNLHDLTKDYLLEHFVLFSSIAATVGTPGQTNHAASNAFEDSLASYRISNGLPATCVNWGNWGEVGVATEIDFPGLRPISTTQGLLALETFLRTQTKHISVLNVDSFALLLKICPQLRHYLDDTRLLGEVKTMPIMNSDEFWNEVDSAANREEKLNCFKKFIKITIRNILKMDRNEPVHDHADFQILGIDSLMMLEMKNGLQNVLGGRMTLAQNQLKDCSNTEMLANTLVDTLLGDAGSDMILPSPEKLKQLIRDDSNLLPEAFSTENLERKSIEQVETVLLTGATGFLGPYLLRDLASRKQIKRVYCLIRAMSKLSAMERLKDKLEEMELIHTVNLSKLEVIEGDITTPMFGLPEDIYLRLCEQVDAIVHSAVKADHISKYWKAPETNVSHMRTVNVLGTVRMLEFAAERRLKHFFHGSTMVAFTGTGKDGKFSEGWQHVSAFDDVPFGTLGYVISKHICEQLVHQALMKGLPCKAFRFPAIAGDSKTGRVNHQQNHAILRWLTYMKLGVIHDIPAPISVMAVDHCAKISLDIFFHPEAPMDVYNVVQKSLDVEQALVEVAHNFGIRLETVTYEQFMKKLKLMENDNSLFADFVKLYEEEESGFISMFENPSVLALKKYFEGGRSFLCTSKLAIYANDYEDLVEETRDVLKRDFAYLKNVGMFVKYGINATS